MREDELIEEPEAWVDPWSNDDAARRGVVTSWRLKTQVLSALRSGPIPGDDELETAASLATLVHGEYEAYGTNGEHRIREDAEITLAQKTLSAVLERHGIALDLPWRDYTRFRTHWNRNGGHGSWQARRDMLAEAFDPVFAELDRLENAAFRANTAEAVSPHAKTGWSVVDEEITALKARFRSASTTQDYRDVGNRSVAVLEALSRTVFDPARHLREGETVPPPDKTKQRLDRYVEDSLGGADNAGVRAVAKKVIELAHEVKHSQSPSRRDAGITADSVILLANILRRVDQDL